MSAGAGLIAAGMLQLQSPQLREAGEGLPAPVPNPRQCWPSEGVRRGLYLFKMVLFYIVGIEVIVVEGRVYSRWVYSTSSASGLSSGALSSAGSRSLSLDSSIMGPQSKDRFTSSQSLFFAWSSATTALR